MGHRIRAIGARVQQVASRGDRVAILAPQGLDYIAGFFAAIKAGTIAVPLFAPELQGHAERLAVALHDSRPTVVLTTSAASAAVEAALTEIGLAPRPHVIAIDDVPDSAADALVPVHIDAEDISHLQYTSGSTRDPVGVEITHRAVGTNLTQMILSIDLLDRNTHGCSWLPLYHDMGLSMIGFPTVYGGHSTLMSPAAFIRRPERWIHALAAGSRQGRVVTAAPNFACEYAAQRGLPAPADDVDLSNVVLILGSEPVSTRAIEAFNTAFAPYGLPPTAIKPSYGIAEATLFVSTIAPTASPTVVHLDREMLEKGQAVRVAADTRRRGGTCGVRPDSPQPMVRHRGSRHRQRASRRPGRRDLVARRQHRPRILGTSRRNPADVRRDPSLADGEGSHATALRPARRGCGRGIWGSTSTVSCMSPGASRI